MKRLLVKGITIAVMVAALVFPSTGIASAHHTPTPFFQPPPGCTDDWNTAQSAQHSHAPGGSHSPGCAKK